MPLINLNGSLTSDTIAEPRIDPLIARDSEVTAAIDSHVAAADPHATYLNTTRGDARYRSLGFNFFTSGHFANYESQMEIRSSPNNASAYLCFHRPGIFYCNLGVGTDNALRIGGLSYGNTSYKIWHEGIVPNPASHKLITGNCPTGATSTTITSGLYAHGLNSNQIMGFTFQAWSSVANGWVPNSSRRTGDYMHCQLLAREFQLISGSFVESSGVLGQPFKILVFYSP